MPLLTQETWTLLYTPRAGTRVEPQPVPGRVRRQTRVFGLERRRPERRDVEPCLLRPQFSNYSFIGETRPRRPGTVWELEASQAVV